MKQGRVMSSKRTTRVPKRPPIQQQGLIAIRAFGFKKPMRGGGQSMTGRAADRGATLLDLAGQVQCKVRKGWCRGFGWCRRENRIMQGAPDASDTLCHHDPISVSTTSCLVSTSSYPMASLQEVIRRWFAETPPRWLLIIAAFTQNTSPRLPDRAKSTQEP